MAESVVLCLGQSNMRGNDAYVSQLTSPWTGLSAPYSAVQMSIDLDWANGAPAYTTGGWVDLGPMTYNNGDFGPEVQIGRVLDAYDGTANWHLLKSARGSTSLTEWSPGAGGTYNLFDNTKQRLDVRLAQLTDPTVKGIVWVQGTNDADTLAEANEYGGRLTHFIDTWRRTYGRNIPVVIVELHKDCLNTYTEGVRRAQRVVAANLPNVSIVNCDDLTLSLNHYDDNGYAEMGDRIGDALVALLQNPDPEPVAGWIGGYREGVTPPVYVIDNAPPENLEEIAQAADPAQALIDAMQHDTKPDYLWIGNEASGATELVVGTVNLAAGSGVTQLASDTRISSGNVCSFDSNLEKMQVASAALDPGTGSYAIIHITAMDSYPAANSLVGKYAGTVGGFNFYVTTAGFKQVYFRTSSGVYQANVNINHGTTNAQVDLVQRDVTNNDINLYTREGSGNATEGTINPCTSTANFIIGNAYGTAFRGTWGLTAIWKGANAEAITNAMRATLQTQLGLD